MAWIPGFLKTTFETTANQAANDLHKFLMKDEEKQLRDSAKEELRTVQMIATAVAAVSILFFAVFANAFTFVMAAATTVAAYDTLKLTDNVLEILNDVKIEMIARLTNDSMRKQLSKNTLALGRIMEWWKPSFEPVLLLSKK